MHSISSPFTPVRFRTSTSLSLHFAYITSIHLSTAQLREILISISQAHSFRFPQALFQRTSNGIYFFLRRVRPNKINPLRESGKLFGRTANIKNHRRPHHPVVVQKKIYIELIIHVLAVYAFHSVSILFRVQLSFLR